MLLFDISSDMDNHVGGAGDSLGIGGGSPIIGATGIYLSIYIIYKTKIFHSYKLRILMEL